jgi:hypothetical protein
MSDSPSTSFVLTCPGCQKRFLLKNANMLNKRATCKSCGAGFLVDGSVIVECESKDIPPFKQKPWPERTEFEIPSVPLLAATDPSQTAVDTKQESESEPTLPVSALLAQPPSVKPELIEWFTAKSLLICAAVVLLIYFIPSIANVVRSQTPATAISKNPITEPEPVVEEQPRQKLELLDLSEEFVFRFMKTQGKELKFIGGNDQKRVFAESETPVFVVLQGNAENLSVVSVMVKVNDLDHGDGTANNEVVKAYLDSIKIVVMATRPSLSIEIAKWADMGMVSAMINKEASVKHGGLAFVMACEIKEEHNSFLTFNMFADQTL